MLGVLGGGQLGRYFVMAAHELGYRVMVLDPDRDSPAGRIADAHLVAGYDDIHAIDAHGGEPAPPSPPSSRTYRRTLIYLARSLPVRPGAEALRICQDRSAEKAFSGRTALPHAPLPISAARPTSKVRLSFPGILKVARFGYDGKGQTTGEGHGRGAGGLSPHSRTSPVCWNVGWTSTARSRWCWRATRPARSSASRPARTTIARRHSRRLHRPGPRRPGRRGRGDRRRDRRADGLCRHPGRRVLRRRGSALCQRNRAPTPQLRPLHAGCLRDQPVRAAGARALRPAAGRYPRPLLRPDGQSARRPLVSRRRRRPGTRTGASCLGYPT